MTAPGSSAGSGRPTGGRCKQVLEDAAAQLNGGAPVASIVAGRTDAGVHAAGQVAHIDLPRGLPPNACATR